MAGWLILLDQSATPSDYAAAGVYGTFLREGTKLNPTHLKTLADFATMRAGDLVFFFNKREIFGVCELVPVGANEVALCNWPSSDDLSLRPPRSTGSLLWDAIAAARWICTFRPAPLFMTKGIDMDSLLSLDKRGLLQHLRVLSGRSFFKLEDEECRFILTALLRLNRVRKSPPKTAFVSPIHERILRLTDGSTAGYCLDPRRTISSTIRGRNVHELAVQIWLDHKLARRQAPLFGYSSYVGNLEPASPLKPREYMDEIDILAISTRYVRVAGETLNPIDHYTIIELKARQADLGMVIRQTMKYVDWIAHERGGGDYDLVRALIVAPSFAADDVRDAVERRVRQFVRPIRPYDTQTWSDLRLIQFKTVPAGPGLVDLAMTRVRTP